MRVYHKYSSGCDWGEVSGTAPARQAVRVKATAAEREDGREQEDGVALTVLYVPYSLNSGLTPDRRGTGVPRS